MSINLKIPDVRELKPRITVFGTGGAGGNAVNNMITSGLQGVDFVVANTDAQALTMSKAERIIQMGVAVTEGLGAGSQPEVGRAAAEEAIDEIRDHLQGAHMVFVTAGMGGGTGTGAAPVVARCAKDAGILTVGVITKPFHFEGVRRMRVAEHGIVELQKVVDTLLIIPNQNLFRVANEKTTFADAFAMADQVLYSGVACITDLMVKEGLINLDFADVRAVMREMGKAMMGTGEASGEKRALSAAEASEARPFPSPGPGVAAPAAQTAQAIEAAAKGAVAGAVLPMIEDVTIRPIPPKPPLFPEHMALPADPPPAPRAFIPPAPERTLNRPRRMPGIDELPRPAQAELRAKRGEGEVDSPEKRKVSLLRRLAAVGLGRRDELEEGEKMPAHVRPVRPPPAPRPLDRPTEQPVAASPPRPAMPPPQMPSRAEPVSENARLPAHHDQGLESLSRQRLMQPPLEEDQLDIPAFLRRQAN